MKRWPTEPVQPSTPLRGEKYLLAFDKARYELGLNLIQHTALLARGLRRHDDTCCFEWSDVVLEGRFGAWCDDALQLKEVVGRTIYGWI